MASEFDEEACGKSQTANQLLLRDELLSEDVVALRRNRDGTRLIDAANPILCKAMRT
jgi:hypothetical protein